MDKRKFLKIGLSGTVGLISLKGFSGMGSSDNAKVFVNPNPGFSAGDLEPFLSEKNLNAHFKYQAAYTNQLNKEIKTAGINPQNAKQILRNASMYNSDLVNACGGFLNHRMYWKCLSNNKNNQPVGRLKEQINLDFGSYEILKTEFKNKALSHKENGWAWLIYQEGKLRVCITGNNENPLMNTLPISKRGIPVITLDLWEHAYASDYQNRSEYIDAHWNILDWKNIDNRFRKQL